jgi:hypothetical protein
MTAHSRVGGGACSCAVRQETDHRADDDVLVLLVTLGDQESKRPARSPRVAASRSVYDQDQELAGLSSNEAAIRGIPGQD